MKANSLWFCIYSISRLFAYSVNPVLRYLILETDMNITVFNKNDKFKFTKNGDILTDIFQINKK